MQRAPDTGKRVAVVGGGPAGLACAHRLAVLGHSVTVFEAKAKAGGLNEYGIAAYKSTDEFARRELEYLLAVGGIEVRTGCRIGVDISLQALRAEHDAVFLGAGLGGVNRLEMPGFDLPGVVDAVDVIADVRQGLRASMPLRVAVVGGGMTAIDAAVQASILGAREVVLVYRGRREKMRASHLEQSIALQHGVSLLCESSPVGVKDLPDGLELVVAGPGGERELAVDLVMMAIGQQLAEGLSSELADAGLALVNGKVDTDENGATSVAGLWAGGDCTGRGEDLTVEAVEAGKRAAIDINSKLAGGR